MAELKKLDLDQTKVTNKTAQQSNPIPMPTSPQLNNKKFALVLLLIVLAGIASGFTLDKLFPNQSFSGSSLSPASSTDISNLKVGDEIGSDLDTFSDTAEGVIEKGGLNGEGSHKLLRSGGISQTVYLTSSVIDLDEFVDHKIKVWGETFAAQQAGWLMDVGRIKVIELNAAKPE